MVVEIIYEMTKKRIENIFVGFKENVLSNESFRMEF